MAMDPKKPVKTKPPERKMPGSGPKTNQPAPAPAKRVPPIRTGPGVKVR